jgi:hypothetical protein
MIAAGRMTPNNGLCTKKLLDDPYIRIIVEQVMPEHLLMAVDSN